ncbi:phage tail protein [Streptomyces triticagri]|uniref:Phage tail protein n=1 Tax=Streptomyces triticagri TaxID=2293568 RepID=A0A372M201_9ACTN|nr:spherulation-specific family 4 protein [Streptomyces triticagri]RFU84921.1 phage tail protein [Streptomyces triticagri]
MPHLISTGPQHLAAAADRLGFGIPGFAHPLVAPAEWAELTRPQTPLHWTVLNVANGPGSRPDPHCLAAAGRLRNGGGRVLGSIDMAHGTRSFGELVSDAHRYLDWYKADGFYMDRCPTERTALPEVRRITTTLRALRDGAHLVLGHGSHPYQGYIEAADQLVTFAGPWSAYRWSQAAEWTGDHPAERFCHFVHSVPRGHLDEALRIARWQGASTIYFTDRTDRGGQVDPWEAMPGYWDEIVSRIGPGVSE